MTTWRLIDRLKPMAERGKKLFDLMSLVAVLALCGRAWAEEANSAGAKVDFARDVQPIFKAACYQCHGPDKQKGKLRLDSKAIALHGGKSGKSIVPGQAGQSELLRRITSKDEDERMPQDREPLTAEQIATIKAWIGQGANWPDAASAADA